MTPNQGKGPVRVTGEVTAEANLSALGDAVNKCETPHKAEHAPGVALVLFAKLDADSAKTAAKALGGVEGVDAEGSKADAKKGEISAKLAGGDKEVTLADILKALSDAGIEAATTK